MKSSLSRLSSIVFATGLMTLGSAEAWGCATCYGASDSHLTAGMNWGILVLAGVAYTVLMGIVGFFGYLMHRARNYPEVSALQVNPRPSPQGKDSF